MAPPVLDINAASLIIKECLTPSLAAKLVGRQSRISFAHRLGLVIDGVDESISATRDDDALVSTRHRSG